MSSSSNCSQSLLGRERLHKCNCGINSPLQRIRSAEKTLLLILCICKWGGNNKRPMLWEECVRGATKPAAGAHKDAFEDHQVQMPTIELHIVSLFHFNIEAFNNASTILEIMKWKECAWQWDMLKNGLLSTYLDLRSYLQNV